MSPDEVRQLHQLLHDQGVPLDVTVTPTEGNSPKTSDDSRHNVVRVAAHGDEITINNHPQKMLMQVKQMLEHYPHPVTVNGETLETSPAPTEACYDSASTGHPLIHSPIPKPNRLPENLHVQGLSYRHEIRQLQHRPAETQFAEHFTVVEEIAVEPQILTDELPAISRTTFSHRFDLMPETLRQADEQYAAAESKFGIDPKRPEPVAAWPPPPQYYSHDDGPRNLLWTDLTPVNLDIDDPVLAFTVAAALYGQNHGYIPVSDPTPAQMTFRSMDISTTDGDELTVRSADESPHQRPFGGRASSITLHLEVDGKPVTVSADIATCGSRQQNSEAFFVTKGITDHEFIASILMKAFWGPPYHGAERFDNSHYSRAVSTAAVRAVHGEATGLQHEAERLLTNFTPQSALPESGEFKFEHHSGWTLTYRRPDTSNDQ